MTLAELYDDLATRAWHALAEVKARARTGDEDTGHQFHGNQWTGGLGAKPKTITAKTSKAGVHELLSSGHPFTKQELMQVCGIKTEKLLSDYLAMLKNPKYAGPKGALAIQQHDGHYYVAMPNGQPAPPLEKATAKQKAAPDDLDFENDPTLDPKAAEGDDLYNDDPFADPKPGETATLPDKNGQPDWGALNQATKLAGHDPSTQAAMANLMASKPVADPTDAYELKDDEDPPEEVAAAIGTIAAAQAPDKGIKALQAVHPGSMPKGEADAHYKAHIDAAYAELSLMAKAGIGGEIAKEHALKFKQAKATGMAAWATAVHGTAYSPKKQEVYKADLQLVQDAKDFSQDAALNNWKSNTAAEKMGNFPPKVASPATKAAAATKPEPIADMGSAAPVQPIAYDTLVPETHKPIGPEDFATHDGAWTKGLSKVKANLLSTSTGSDSENKSMVENALRTRLKDKPNFQALVKRLGLAKEGYASLESRLIAAWAGSSGDHHEISVALQMAVRDAFSMPDSHIEKAALGSLNQYGHDVDKLTSVAIKQLNPNTKALQPHEIQTARAALQEFVQAQYHETQDLLQKLGHDHVYLARGMKVSVQHANGQGPANVKLQPASSFSTGYSTANSFSGGKTVFLMKVPRQQVLSTYLTGFGCTGENEVVVLAHNSLKAYTVPAGLSQASAAERVQGEITKAAAGKPAKGSLEEFTAKTLANMKTAEKLASKSKHAKTLATMASAKPAPTQTLHPDAGNYAEKHAALKKAVINAKSKALKAKQAAAKYAAQVKVPEASPLVVAKTAHAQKAAEEAKAAVQSLQSFMSQWKGK